MDHFASKSNLKASVLAAHSGDIDFRSTGAGLPQSGALLGLVEGVCREEEVRVGWFNE